MGFPQQHGEKALKQCFNDLSKDFIYQQIVIFPSVLVFIPCIILLLLDSALALLLNGFGNEDNSNNHGNPNDKNDSYNDTKNNNNNISANYGRVKVDEEKKKELQTMGFKNEEIIKALQQTNNDVNKALSILLGEASNSNSKNANDNSKKDTDKNTNNNKETPEEREKKRKINQLVYLGFTKV